jgi:tetratricopeptide (TPR) repeat protein
MFNRCCSFERRIVRAWFVGLIVAAAVPMGAGTTTLAQPSTKGAANPDDKGAEAAPQRSNTEVLIGDAVDNADSPQFRQVTEAIDKVRRGQWKEARDLLTEARTTHRQLPPAEVLMAKLFILAGQSQLALQQLEDAVRKHPKDPEPYLMFAEGSLADRHITAAEALYRDADALVKEFKENPKRKAGFEKRVLHGLAAVAESRQQWATAEALLRQLIKLDPDNFAAHQRLGQVLFQQARPDPKDPNLSQSWKAFVAAYKAEPKTLTPDIAMGQLFEQAAQQATISGDKSNFKYYRDQAAAAFGRATTSSDGYKPDLNTYLAAAMWALQTTQLKPAQRWADAAMKQDPDSVNAKLVAAVVARFNDDFATAKRLLQEAFNQSPSNFAVSNQLALVLIESKEESDKKRAFELARINANLYSNNAEAASTLGWVLYHLGQRQQAGQVLENVIRSRALTADSAYYVATILNNQGQHAEAIAILENALANPQPFANRMNATEELADAKKKLEAIAQKETEDESAASSKNGARGAKSTKGTK